MFHWKDFNDKFKGEGIYHLTFTVNNRVPLLGDLSALDDDAQTPIIIPTQLGTIVRQEAERIHTLNPNIQIITKCLMPDHFHLLLWSHDANEGSIKMTARGFSQACSKAARRLHQQSNPRPSAPSSPTALPSPVSIPAQSNCANTNAPTPDYSCGNGANTLFSTPFIRTLSHAGQLRTMYSYIQQNPRRAWIKRTHPDLFKLRRNTQVSNLSFSSLGNHWLLEWPVRQTVICSRSITPEALQQLERQILHTSLRWKFMAQNVMLHRMAQE